MARDPYKYFRIEGRELLDGLSQGVLELEKGRFGKESIGHLLRLAHTLKGASRVVKLPVIAEHAHALEEVLAPYREGERPVSRADVTALLRVVDAIAEGIASIEPQIEPRPADAQRPASAPEEPFETVRVEIREMDLLLDGVAEATVQIHSLARESAPFANAQHLVSVLVERLSPRRLSDFAASGAPASLARAHSVAEELRGCVEALQRSISSGIERAVSELVQVRDAANQLRLLPASSIFAALERAVRDAAEALQKRVSFHVSGGESRLDAHVLVALRDAMLHVVRNAVAHGIESESERVVAGKPASGRVEIEVERRGSRVAFICRDDGRGIDVPALRRVAARGASPAPSSMTDQDVLRLLLQGGLSTANTITQVSGRGIGLDVVRSTAARLKGEVSIRSEPGRGITLEICVPVSLSSLSVLVVDAGGVPVSVPLDAVRRTLRLADSEIARSSESDSIVYDGKVIPFVPLTKALGMRLAHARKQPFWSAVVVQSGAALAAIGVDRLLGTSDVVVRALPLYADAEPIVAGASLNAEGNPQLVLDAEGLVAAARLGRGLAPNANAAPRLPVLVVDDSLTTRMLEQSILESAGYEVELATSAEEALEKAASSRYSLFVVDVEMPGMDGFEFVTRTRIDPVLRHIPAILVTSRGTPEDRQRGKDAGAHAYIVKGEFDQGYLLQTIRDLLGET